MKQESNSFTFDDQSSNMEKSLKDRQANLSHSHLNIISPINTIQKGLIDEDNILDNACAESEIHKLKIQPKSVYTFYLIFKPKLPGFYEF